ncbi:hypothetical protein Dda_8180 [Drechslerella dactyloides]|uniref:Uncharacterized protein n=1 Tax=Drechslerella dactyloides TaxID=74499 RepID=A0AAD6NFA0_DREDA|nr:hypothetical protein Dda_8180 [Drechslerella dactyloides]
MSTAVSKNASDKLEAERTLIAIRRDLERLHRLAPASLPKGSYHAIVALLPSSQDILAAPPQPPSATASAFATLRFTRRVLVSTVVRAIWLTIFVLAAVGGTTVGFMLLIYLLTKMDWNLSFADEGRAWRQHSDGYYYWGMPQESYTSTVQATVVTDVPEIDGRDI